MKTIWRNQTIDVRETEVQPQNISEGDWLLNDGVFLRVITVQKGCPRWESNKSFTMFTCESETGKVIPVRDLQGWQTVLKKVKVRVIKDHGHAA